MYLEQGTINQRLEKIARGKRNPSTTREKKRGWNSKKDHHSVGDKRARGIERLWDAEPALSKGGKKRCPGKLVREQDVGKCPLRGGRGRDGDGWGKKWARLKRKKRRLCRGGGRSKKGARKKEGSFP